MNLPLLHAKLDLTALHLQRGESLHWVVPLDWVVHGGLLVPLGVKSDINYFLHGVKTDINSICLTLWLEPDAGGPALT